MDCLIHFYAFPISFCSLFFENLFSWWFANHCLVKEEKDDLGFLLAWPVLESQLCGERFHLQKTQCHLWESFLSSSHCSFLLLIISWTSCQAGVNACPKGHVHYPKGLNLYLRQNSEHPWYIFMWASLPYLSGHFSLWEVLGSPKRKEIS